MTLQENEYEIEVRSYTKQGSILNQKWLKKDLKEVQTLFPGIDFANEEKDSTWVETKEQAEFLEINFEDLSSVDYEVFMYYS